MSSRKIAKVVGVSRSTVVRTSFRGEYMHKGLYEMAAAYALRFLRFWAKKSSLGKPRADCFAKLAFGSGANSTAFADGRFEHTKMV